MGGSNDDDDDTSDGRNVLAAQDPSELFDLYPPPPSPSMHNTIIDELWGPLHHPSPRPTGECKVRSRVHADGDWHRSVQVWIAERCRCRGVGTDGDMGDGEGGEGDGIIDDDDIYKVRVLLQRRSHYKDTHPDLLDVSCAGHVDAGDGIVETAMRELEEELGLHCVDEVIHGNGGESLTKDDDDDRRWREYSRGDVKKGRAFTASSVKEGETERHGRFVCREYQEVFVLWWNGDVSEEQGGDGQRPLLHPNLFAPQAMEEVAGFEITDGRNLIRRLREGDRELVPRSPAYVDALERVLGWRGNLF